MRFLFLLILLANVALFAYGQGIFGSPPSERGRNPRPLQQDHQTAITLAPPLPTQQTTH